MVARSLASIAFVATAICPTSSAPQFAIGCVVGSTRTVRSFAAKAASADSRLVTHSSAIDVSVDWTAAMPLPTPPDMNQDRPPPIKTTSAHPTIMSIGRKPISESASETTASAPVVTDLESPNRSVSRAAYAVAGEPVCRAVSSAVPEVVVRLAVAAR